MTQEPDRTSGRFDLAVWGTVVGSFRTVFVDHRGHLPRALCVPFLLSLLLSFLWFHTTDFGQSHPEGLASFAGMFLWPIADAVPFVIFAVSWHRLILFGPGKGTPHLWPVFGARHVSYFGYFFLYYVGYVIVAALFFFAFAGLLAALPSPSMVRGVPPAYRVEFYALVTLLLDVAGLYVVARIGFVLPAIAADRAYPLADTWADTKAFQWRLFGSLVLATLPYALFNKLYYIVSNGLEPLAMPGAASATTWQQLAAVLMANEVVVALIAFLTTAIGATLITQVFTKQLASQAPPGTPPSKPQPAETKRKPV